MSEILQMYSLLYHHFVLAAAPAAWQFGGKNHGTHIKASREYFSHSSYMVFFANRFFSPCKKKSIKLRSQPTNWVLSSCSFSPKQGIKSCWKTNGLPLIVRPSDERSKCSALLRVTYPFAGRTWDEISFIFVCVESARVDALETLLVSVLLPLALMMQKQQT